MTRRRMSASTHSWRGLPIGAKAFIGLVIAAGMASLLQAAIHQSSKNIAEFICYLGIAILASRLRVTLPGITGTLSVNFLFILVAVAELSYSEALTLGAVSMLAQSIHPNRPGAIQLTFHTTPRPGIVACPPGIGLIQFDRLTYDFARILGE